MSNVITLSANDSCRMKITVTPKLSGCSNGTVQTTYVIVNPTPSVALTNNATGICNGGNINVDVNSPTRPSNFNNLTFDYVIHGLDGTDLNGAAAGTDISGTLDPGVPGDLPLKMINTITISTNDSCRIKITVTPKLSGCSDGTVQTTYVVVNPTPSATLTNNAAVIC